MVSTGRWDCRTGEQNVESSQPGERRWQPLARQREPAREQSSRASFTNSVPAPSPPREASPRASTSAPPNPPVRTRPRALLAGFLIPAPSLCGPHPEKRNSELQRVPLPRRVTARSLCTLRVVFRVDVLTLMSWRGASVAAAVAVLTDGRRVVGAIRVEDSASTVASVASAPMPDGRITYPPGRCGRVEHTDTPFLTANVARVGQWGAPVIHTGAVVAAHATPLRAHRGRSVRDVDAEVGRHAVVVPCAILVVGARAHFGRGAADRRIRLAPLWLTP